MMAAPAPQPFFLGSGAAARFALYHGAAGPCRGAYLYLHPFAEEMNKARRMAALQARALAQAGYAVLQLDLHGCGDSAGDFGDASWESWRADTARGLDWLQDTVGRPAGLWGCRLGALLALDHAQHAASAPAQLLLWQPVTQGGAHLTQFLRLQLAARMLDDGATDGGTAALRASLAAGTALEIAGYALAPALAGALDRLDAAAWTPPCPLRWLEVAAAPDRPLSPLAARLLRQWQAAGVDAQGRSVAGPAFWATQETAEAPALLAATIAAAGTEACHA